MFVTSVSQTIGPTRCKILYLIYREDLEFVLLEKADAFYKANP
jgi:hypothetical protein